MWETEGCSLVLRCAVSGHGFDRNQVGIKVLHARQLDHRSPAIIGIISNDIAVIADDTEIELGAVIEGLKCCNFQ